MSTRAKVAATGAGISLASYFALLCWVTVTYGNAPSLPFWVNTLLGLLLAAFAAFIAIFIIYARRDNKA